MTSDEIENNRVEKLKEIAANQERIFLVQDEIHSREMEIIRIEDSERKPLEDSIRKVDEKIRAIKVQVLELKATAKKARETSTRLRNEEEILKSDYWRSKA